jgi:lipooligosaccharide transport system permease protein
MQQALVVYLRQFLAWRYYIKNFVVLSVFDPLLWIYAMGLGLTGMFKLDGGSYMLFVATGMTASVIAWSVAMDATINTMRRQEDGLWRAAFAASVPLASLTLGEALFSATRGMVASAMVVLVSLFFVDIPNLWGVIPALMCVWLGGMVLHFACLCFTALARGFADFDFFWPLVLNPMFIFSGVFFATTALPAPALWFANALPLIHVVQMVRMCLMGTFEFVPFIIHLGILLVMGMFYFALQYRLFQRKVLA